MPATRYGGPIRSVHGLCKALAARGHSVTVMTTNVDGPNDSDVPLKQAVERDGVAVWYFRSPTLRRLYWSPGLKKALRNQISKFDIVHLHSVFLWPTLVAARLARRANVPYVISPRGMLVEDLIHRKSRLKKQTWIRLFESRSLRRAAAIHLTSEVERAELEKLGLAVAHTEVIANGIDAPHSSALHEDSRKLMPDVPYVLFLSRLNWKKGLDRLIAAISWVPGAKFIIAGNDEDGYRRHLELMAREAGVQERISFVGPVGDHEKWCLYENAELFVLPSYSESFGIAALEAMAMGCPVVVTPEVGLAPAITRHACGAVVEGTPKRLGNAIAALLGNGELRKEMGQRGREAARRDFGWPEIARQMEAVYQRAVTGVSQSRGA